MPLTTPARVRQRLDIQSWESSDAIINQYFTDTDASIKNFIGTLPTSGDDDYALASSVCTDLAAFYTGISLPQPFDKEEAKSRKQKIDAIKSAADVNLAQLLKKPHAVLLARTTTP
ncbi:MAG: hypothetical protein PF495_06180 [Spirochaetales bacterium]|jgi:hypothetical protein|nr:hypothetical protein [Spirochaetales bacterium]